jgi:4-hydroxybenzoyl-CoA reductase subunit beta
MILPKLAYKRAKSLEEAIHLFQKYDEKAFYLAGGTDMVPQLKLRLHKPTALIDLKNIGDLKGTDVHEGWLSIGANTTLFALKNDPVVREYFPALSESLDATSCETLQMRGTIGGNILQNTRCLFYNKSLEWRKAKGFCLKLGGETCNVAPNSRACFANYCSDNVPSLLTLSAEVTFNGIGGKRRMSLAEIFSGDSRTPFRITPDEILTRILIPLRKTKGAYEKIRVRDSIDYPLVNAAISVEDGRGKLSIGAVGPVPFVYNLKNMKENTVEEITDRVYSDSKPVANTTLPASYRKRMSRVLAKRVVAKVLQEGRS